MCDLLLYKLYNAHIYIHMKFCCYKSNEKKYLIIYYLFLHNNTSTSSFITSNEF